MSHPGDAPQVDADLRAHWRQAQVTVDLGPAPAGEPLGRTGLDTFDQTLGTQHTALPPQGVDALIMGETLGMGGQAIVRSAQQQSLGRSVAVKAQRHASPAARGTLLREAWIAGRLEHPNIVPIHTLTTDARGEPMLVMKRIDGVSWARALRDPRTLPGPEPPDMLEWNLRVLMQVCQAVEFAHTQGIAHLDIKPGNVMLGAHGEVYLLDWGLAVSVSDAGPDWLPMAADIRRVVGTPAFLSPEQACGDGRGVGRATDQYLLGASLYLIINDRPLRRGSSIAAITHAWRGTIPGFVPGTPARLEAICRRALAYAPSDRFRSVRRLRRAIEDFLRHRHATAMATTALAQLPRILPEPLADPRAMHEARFGLQQALAAWPEHPEAAEALQALLTRMIESHLAREEVDAAAAILSELPQPDPEIHARIEAARTAARCKAEEVAALRRGTDLSVNRRRRSAWVLGIGLFWLLCNLASGALHRSGTIIFTYGLLTGISALTVVLFGLGIWWVRDTLGRIDIERRMLAVFGSSLLIAFGLWFMGARLGMTVVECMSMSTVLYVFFAMVQAANLDRGIWWTVPALSLIAVMAGLWPAYGFEWVGAAGLVCGVIPMVIWRRDE